jgi:hypothetical protein
VTAPLTNAGRARRLHVYNGLPAPIPACIARTSGIKPVGEY